MFVNGVIGCYSIGSPVSYYCMRQTEKYKAALKREEDLHFELQSTHDQLKIRSRLDMMTGLLNRETFLAEMEEAKSKYPDRTSSVILLDVDHFKRINDTWGHHAGDEALVQIGASILAVFGSDSLAGRIGGEEFAIFCRVTMGLRQLFWAKRFALRLNGSLSYRYPVVEKSCRLVSVSPVRTTSSIRQFF